MRVRFKATVLGGFPPNSKQQQRPFVPRQVLGRHGMGWDAEPHEFPELESAGTSVNRRRQRDDCHPAPVEEHIRRIAYHAEQAELSTGAACLDF